MSNIINNDMSGLNYEISNKLNGKLNNSKSPYVKLIIPETDDNFDNPETLTIEWDTGYINSRYFLNVKIDLYTNEDVFVSTLTSSTSNDGSYIWSISSVTTGFYKIKVSVVGWEDINGDSGVFYMTLPITYSNVGWILLNEKIEDVTFQGVTNPWILLNEKIEDVEFAGNDEGWLLTTDGV